MKEKLLTLVLAVCLWHGTNDAQAELIAIQISGEVTALYGDAPTTIHVNDTFVATYTYESTMTDSGDGIYFGHYVYDAPYGMTLDLAGYAFATHPSHTGQFEIRAWNDVNMATDSLVVNSYANVTSPAGGPEFDVLSWGLSDNTHVALSSDELITTAPVLSDWDSNTFTMVGADNAFSIEGIVTEAILVPEPAAGILLLTSGVFLLRRERRSKSFSKRRN